MNSSRILFREHRWLQLDAFHVGCTEPGLDPSTLIPRDRVSRVQPGTPTTDACEGQIPCACDSRSLLGPIALPDKAMPSGEHLAWQLLAGPHGHIWLDGASQARKCSTWTPALRFLAQFILHTYEVLVLQRVRELQLEAPFGCGSGLECFTGDAEGALEKDLRPDCMPATCRPA